MDISREIVILLGGFVIVAVASRSIAGFFQRFHLPLISGLLLTGVISGPYVLGLLGEGSRDSLRFISDIGLSYIAFAAGSELYLKELRSRFRSIKFITISQSIITVSASSVLIYFALGQFPLFSEISSLQKGIIAALCGVIFIARSPASAIAVINEVRARGPFTKTVMGVTVLKDFVVIILFSVVLSLSIALNEGGEVRLGGLFIVFLELLVSVGLGYLLGKLMDRIMTARIFPEIKKIIILLLGYSVYLGNYSLMDLMVSKMGISFQIEPLITCILASFYVTNNSRGRAEFTKLIHETGLPIFVLFFTYSGSLLEVDLIGKVWPISLSFFGIRLFALIVGTYVGGTLAGDEPSYNRLGWMGYITQAGVALGLVMIVARTFPEWGYDFATVLTVMIIVNDLLGPPLFKWVLGHLKESHSRAQAPAFDGTRDAIIFGFDNQSLALARQLKENQWEVKIVTNDDNVMPRDYPEFDIRKLKNLNLSEIETLDPRKSEAIVLMLTDEENYRLLELFYENIGTKDMVVRLNHRFNFEKFHKLGALIVDPSTAIVSLLDHFVRSPQAASLLLGLQTGQDTMDLEVLNPDLHGLALRDLRLPSDVILLSVMRGGQMIITHGYTRLRMGDVVTMVGSKESLNNLQLRFDGPSLT